MNRKLKRIWRSATALCMAFVMMFSTCGTVLAQGDDKETIKYVSLGDSMTNGYGLAGYQYNGYLQDVPESYPAKFAEYLTNAATVNVEHTPLAMSAMRAEDLHFILEFDYNNTAVVEFAEASRNWGEFDEEAWNAVFTTGDAYTWDEFVNRDRFNESAYNNFVKGYGAGTANVARTYQEAVAAADIVSVGSGNANMGVFLLGRIMNAIGFGDGDDSWIALENALRECDPQIQAAAMDVYNELKAQLAAAELPAELVDAMTNAIVYTMVSYMLNYAGAIDAIVELNSDVEVMIVGLMNTMNGMNFSYGGKTYDLGAYMYKALRCMNAYLSALPATLQASGKYPEATFYYAAASNVDVMVNNYKDTIKGEVTTTRERFITEIVGTANNPGMVWELLSPMVGSMMAGASLEFIELKDIEAYEKMSVEEKAGLATTDKNQAISCALYLAFEDAIVESSTGATMSFEGLMALGNLDASLFGNVMVSFETNRSEVEKSYIPAASAVVAAGSGNAVSAQWLTDWVNNPDAMVAFVEKQLGNAIKQDIELYHAGSVKKFIEDHSSAECTCESHKGKAAYNSLVLPLKTAIESVEMLCMLLALPETMSDALQSDEMIFGLLNMFARCLIGDGLGAHPSAKGHDTLFAAVKASYANGHTVQKETIKNIETALNKLCKLLETYGPEVAAQVWAQWVEYGYVDAVNATINELTAVLEARYEAYTTETLPAVNASVTALTEQKDVLTAQLVSLNEQLAAKKAELEKVLSEQEIGSVTVPDININVELGNNEQTEVPEHECVVSVDGNAIVAELEAAIKDIEHAIATVEALVADVEADIEDMVALAVQIADAVASLEATIKDIAQAANDVKEAVAAVVEVLTNESADSIVSTVVGTYETVRAAALEAANLLDVTMGAAEETMADIDKMVVILSGDAEALYNKFVEELPGCIDQIPEEGKMLLGAAVLGLQKAYEEGEKLVKEKLAEELLALEAEYADDIAKAEADLEAIKAEIQAEIDAKYAEAVAETQAKIDAAKAEAEELLTALEAELKGYQDELAALGAEAAEEVRQTIQAKIDRVTEDINTVNEDLACAVQHLEAALQLTYEAIVAEVNALYAEAVAQLEKVYNDIMAELEAAKKALEEAADKALEDLKEAIDKQIEEFNKIGEELSEQLNSVLDSIRENINSVQEAVKGILSGSLEAVEELKNALEAMGAEALADLVDIIVEQINAMLLEATTADMVVDDDFKFVAIGDESAKAEGYVERLAAAINAEAKENGVSDIEVVNYAKTGNTVAAERANLSDVTDADLVTIGFSNVTFLNNALDAAMSGNAGFDWAGLLGEEALPYVEDVLADIKAEIAALELREEYTVMLETIVEAMAYNAVEYAVELPGLISDIKAVNSDALIIIVGMYNPLADTTINIGGAEFNVSEYVDYLVDAVAVYGIGYAIISGDAIYVDARDVDVENTDKELSVLDFATLVYNKCAALYPSTVGDDYIAAEIADALDITYIRTEKLLGDVNDDGVVDSRDLVRLRRYFAQDGSVINALNSDVNEDGVVDSRDMARLTKYFAQVDGVVLGK